MTRAASGTSRSSVRSMPACHARVRAAPLRMVPEAPTVAKPRVPATRTIAGLSAAISLMACLRQALHAVDTRW